MNTRRLAGFLLLTCTFILSLMGAAAIFAAVHALTVKSTLPAIESAFGSTVIAIGLLITARVCFKAATRRLVSSQREQSR